MQIIQRSYVSVVLVHSEPHPWPPLMGPLLVPGLAGCAGRAGAAGCAGVVCRGTVYCGAVYWGVAGAVYVCWGAV